MFRNPRERTGFSGGGVVADIFPVAAGKDQSNSLNSGECLEISGTTADHPPFIETHRNSGTLGEMIVRST